MPKRKYVSKSRKFRKKTTYRKKRTVGRYKKKGFPLAGIPQTQVVKFRYLETIYLDPSSTGYVTTHQFRGANIFDPNYTGGGNPVAGYTPYATNYAHYMVVGSKITVRAMNTLATSSIPCMYGILLSRTINQLGSLATPDEILRSTGSYGSNGKYRQMGGINGNSTSMSRTFSARKMYGISKKDSIFTYQTLHALFGAGPVEEPTFTLWASNTGGGINPDPVAFLVVIDYLCKVWEPRYITGL